MTKAQTADDDRKIVSLNPPKHYPLGTSKETIIKAMENAKEGETFTMSFAITPKGWVNPEKQAEAAHERAKADNERIAKKLENKNRL